MDGEREDRRSDVEPVRWHPIKYTDGWAIWAPEEDSVLCRGMNSIRSAELIIRLLNEFEANRPNSGPWQPKKATDV